MKTKEEVQEMLRKAKSGETAFFLQNMIQGYVVALEQVLSE